MTDADDRHAHIRAMRQQITIEESSDVTLVTFHGHAGNTAGLLRALADYIDQLQHASVLTFDYNAEEGEAWINLFIHQWQP